MLRTKIDKTLIITHNTKSVLETPKISSTRTFSLHPKITWNHGLSTLREWSTVGDVTSANRTPNARPGAASAREARGVAGIDRRDRPRS
ncbi:hypothetical protein EVAR_19790_1 [Eumeta japonica]|uniref:Uncharacterized protein n=1 Tax=Eumeta variegata TaxID=151549 RepID=A0A4C1UQN1_EUMVA|nr:hypothetical protein EVAR_19790_1 [Eumeta japonica]